MKKILLITNEKTFLITEQVNNILEDESIEVLDIQYQMSDNKYSVMIYFKESE